LTDFSLALGRTIIFDAEAIEAIEAIETMRRLTVSVEQAQANLNTAADNVEDLEMGPDQLSRQQLEAAV